MNEGQELERGARDEQQLKIDRTAMEEGPLDGGLRQGRDTPDKLEYDEGSEEEGLDSGLDPQSFVESLSQPKNTATRGEGADVRKARSGEDLGEDPL